VIGLLGDWVSDCWQACQAPPTNSRATSSCFLPPAKASNYSTCLLNLSNLEPLQGYL